MNQDIMQDVTIDELLKLKNQLCFPLYATSKEIVNLYRPYLDPLNLTYTQYIVMMVLWEYREISVRELGTILYLDSGTLTPLLKKMEHKGLLKKHRSVDDERVVIVTITEAGIQLKESAVQVVYNMMSHINGFTMDEVNELKRLLNKLHTSITPRQK